MLVSGTNLKAMYVSFSAAFQMGFDAGTVYWPDIAMKVSSDASESKYGWLGSFPGIREWVGARVINNLSVHDYTIKNRKFESTIEVDKTDIEDDKIGVLSPFLQQMGMDTKQHPDTMLFELMKAGFTQQGYDGQNMFDTDHPVLKADETIESVSNVQAGAGEPWFLLDTSRALKPFIYQERIPYKFTALDRDEDETVFMQDKFTYGVRARANMGFGLWQLAFGSKADLSATNYALARAAMMGFKRDHGKTLNLKPTVLVCGPANEEKALRLLNAATGAAGESNVWKDTAKLIVAPYLA